MSIKRKIPATMATQHPDHSSRPFWRKDAFIPAVEEARELYVSFADLGISEYMWDWEGKLVDESVLERLYGERYDFFKKLPLGKEKFLTFRLPNSKVESEFRMARALIGLLSSAAMAQKVGMHSPPLFEVILPMTENAKEIISIQEAFSEISNLKHPLNKFQKDLLSHILLIPLFEQVSTIINSANILEEYLEMHKKMFGFKPAYIRPFIARSDPSLNSGLIPTVLAVKIALARYLEFSKKHKLPLYPIIGCGTLPFRGGLNPVAPNRFLNEYPGIRTVTIQSAFRYDFPKSLVTSAIKKLETELPLRHTVKISPSEQTKLIALYKPFEQAYKQTVEGLAPVINQVATAFPKRRERVQHIGLFGYSRGHGKVSLPRAISFTGVLYSLGIPPELIGSGRGLKAAAKNGQLELLEKHYVNLKHDLYFAGKFLYRPGLLALAKKSPAWKNVLADVEEIEKYLGKPLGPKYSNERQHILISAKIHKNLNNKEKLTKLIEQAAVLRRSMG